ncbi:MAG: cation-translocating P-type ATPase [Pirellulaceae bacterium]|jgi:Ca2+-transporting ATPase|nr:cation-translocating P-type ATPase [Thermoguttaceae bacterium]NLZ03333.1 cation-translocating P-type ATPase [Pirellulaceae bacterium]
MDKAWYQLAHDDVCRQLETDASRGLAADEAERRTERYGPNELVERGGRSPWRILWEQVSGVMTVILLVAAAISIFLQEPIDAVVILAIVVLNAALGFYQEFKAARSMAALKRMSVPRVRARRGGDVREISARELVPGDIVLLETGNVVPADGRIVRGVNLRIQESALTGESVAVEKQADIVFESARPLADRRNMTYLGTTVTYGHGEIVVTATGMQTQLGQIADMIQSVGVETTPLQRRLEQLGKVLAVAALTIVALISAIGWLQGVESTELFMTAVSLAVAAVPEAMTAIVTIALSLGAQRMLKRNALIRKLPAVETLGSVSVICTDKTGTLTENRMTVTVIDVANHKLQVNPTAGATPGELTAEEGAPVGEGVLPALELLLIAGALCNDAMLRKEEGEPGTYRAIGDPTENALVLAAARFGAVKGPLEESLPRTSEVPFDSQRKRMTTVHRIPSAEATLPASLREVLEQRAAGTDWPSYVAFSKGALNSLLEVSREVWVERRCQPLDDAWRERIGTAHDNLAAQGMRVLAVALRPMDAIPANVEQGELERDLIFVGMFGMIDPPRPEVKDAVEACRAAGIRPVMITGDHPLTARHIASQVGIGDDERFLTGQELDRLSAEELQSAVAGVSVFARVAPEHKLQLIAAFQAQGHVVSMTGDGVNDAPALKKGDIGVAMGITGTDVAKEASDMILIDDNFATIVAAVEEGRVIYDNVRKFIKYLLSCNASEVLVMFLGPLCGMPLPLLPLQILWMNLVTDGLPALALGVEPAEEDVMRRPPHSSSESIFGRGTGPFILIAGVILSLASLGGVAFLSLASGEAWLPFVRDAENWQTFLFTTLVFSQMALALCVRSESNPLFRLRLSANPFLLLALLVTVVLQLAVVYAPPLQALFHTRPLGPWELAAVFGITVVVFAAVEVLEKLLVKRAR